MEYIRNTQGISINIHNIKKINEQKQRTQTQWGGRLYIYICPKYFPYIFRSMFRNLFSQQ